MTLNTFHLAGRGEMNVTLGIPRLQEIIMTASSDIRTPIMSCPLQKHKTEYDGKRLAAKLKKISVADLIENVEVCLVPVALVDGQKFSIYKLKIKFYERERYHQFLDIVLEDCEKTLEVVFFRALEDAIQSHVRMHSRVSGISTSVSQLNSSTEFDEDLSIDKLQEAKEYNIDDNLDENDDEDNGEEGMENVGMDAEKRKQAKDDIDYEDGDEDESDHETRMEIDQSRDGSENSDGEGEGDEATSDTEAAESEKRKKLSMTKSGKKVSKSNTTEKKRARMRRKKTDRCTFVAAEGVHFEAHFRFDNEPHILLAQIAVKAAQKVHIRSTGKIDRCDVIECKPDNVLPLQGANEGKQWGLQTAGVDFHLFWEMQDDLAINCIYTNNIHAMLTTYGVEAARSTIIREVQNVFKIYGVTVNLRHLTLIADFMTHSGGYRPMSRTGAISDSISPFSKMSFETASKFIVEAACHGLTDNMESPSARVCLGLPVKVGTGCFDVMQEIDVH